MLVEIKLNSKYTKERDLASSLGRLTNKFLLFPVNNGSLRLRPKGKETPKQDSTMEKKQG